MLTQGTVFCQAMANAAALLDADAVEGAIGPKGASSMGALAPAGGLVHARAADQEAPPEVARALGDEG
jgi:hypothetical protein